MVQTNCNCSEEAEPQLESLAHFNAIKAFFLTQTQNKIFKIQKVEQPYYVGVGLNQTLEWYADYWYTCNYCGTLWEVTYPDFPAAGFVRKFTDGRYAAKD